MFLADLFTKFKQAGCIHVPNHLLRDQRVNKDGITEHILVCQDCWKEFQIPIVLTRASGVFERIDIRIEQQQEYAELIKQADEYQKEQTNA